MGRQNDLHGQLRARLRFSQSGKINFITLLLVAGLVFAGYAGFIYLPLWIDHLDVNRRCEESLNSTWRRQDPRHTKEDFLRRIHDIATVEKEIGGDLKEVPAIDPGDYLEVNLDQSVRPPILSIDVSYEREVTLPLIGGTRVFHFSAYCEREAVR